MPTIDRPEDVNLSDPTFWGRPRVERFQAFDLLRRESPVAWQPPPTPWAPTSGLPPRGYWAVTSYDGVRKVSRDPVTFRSGRGVMLFDNLSPEDQYLNDGWVGLDAPQHTRLRRLVTGAFTPRMMSQIEAWVAEQASAHIDAVSVQGECDFFADLVAPLPAGVICTMLGVPSSEQPEVMRLVHEGVHFSSSVPFEETLAAVAAVIEYAKDLSRRLRSEPGKDVMSLLAQSELDGARLSDEEIGATFWVLITGGSDTTSTTAAHAMIAFSQWPESRRSLQADYERLAATAVEEMLRWGTPVLCFRRTAAADTEIEGRPIREGDNVVIFYQSANRDETVFASPHCFDITRNPNPHLAFGGGGPHFCLGAALARLQLRIFFRELLARLPDVEVSGDPVYEPGPFLDSVVSVPCTFTPQRSGHNR